MVKLFTEKDRESARRCVVRSTAATAASAVLTAAAFTVGLLCKSPVVIFLGLFFGAALTVFCASALLSPAKKRRALIGRMLDTEPKTETGELAGADGADVWADGMHFNAILLRQGSGSRRDERRLYVPSGTALPAAGTPVAARTVGSNAVTLEW